MRRATVSVRSTILSVFAAMAAAGAARAEGVFAYPNAGQSEEQQAKDRFECHQWSVNQSGFDPTTAAPLPAQTAYPPNLPPEHYERRASGPLNIGNGGFFEGGGMMGDAATGAALGAAGGALAGDVGEGAAIGALASTVFGALNRASSSSSPSYESNRAYEQQRAQEEARMDQLYLERQNEHDNYKRAYAACMTARQYTVQ
jgi:hypothetical protein